MLPFLEKYEVIDTSIKPIIVNLAGNNGLLTKDNYIFDLTANFSIRVHPERRSILNVAQSVGIEKATSQEYLEEVFIPKFSEALRIVASKFEFEEIKSNLEHLKAQTLQVIPKDLNGFILDDLSINYIPSTIKKLNLG